MLKKILPLALIAAAVPGVHAQARGAGPSQSEKATQTLATAVGAMRDSAGISEELLKAVESQGIAIELQDYGMTTPAAYHEIPADIPVREIIVNTKMAAAMSPSHLGAYIAEQAATVAYEDMPDCADKDFMVLSAMSRSWLELGGRSAQDPKFGGAQDEALAAKIRNWSSTNMEGYVREMQAKGRPSLKSIMSNLQKDAKETLERAGRALQEARASNADPEKVKMIEAARDLAAAQAKLEEKSLQEKIGQAKSFDQAEQDWMLANQYMLGN